MRNIKVAFAKSPLVPYSEPSEPFTLNFTEGPSIVKIGKNWLIYFDSYREKTYNAVKTIDFKKFTDISNQISIPEGHKHGSILKVEESIVNKLLDRYKNK